MSVTSVEPLNAYTTFCPRLREEIVFGPPLRLGARTVYHLKDRSSDWFYRIGAREHFIFSRMDGTRSLRQISEDYASEFGYGLSAQAWDNLFRIIEKRQMLADTIDEEKLEAWKQQGSQQRRAQGRRLLRWRFALVRSDRFLTKLLPFLSFAFHPVFVISVLLCVSVLEIVIGVNAKSMVLTMASYRNPLNIVVFLVLSWLLAALHECAHGLTCKKFGGTVSEMGIIWRYLCFFPYCKTDDMLLFHSRWHRVATALAGIFVNLLCLIPFGLVWWFAPAHSMVKAVSALLLLSFNLTTLMDLFPFIDMDGYFALNHLLGMVDLRKESHLFWQRGALQLFLKRGEGNGARGYTRRDKRIYRIYGLFSLLCTASFLGGMAIFWFSLIQRWSGIGLALALPGLLIVFFLLPARARTWLAQKRPFKDLWPVFWKRVSIAGKKEA